MPDDELTPGHLLLIEYKQLKQEQLARIGIRDNLVYVTLASLAAVVAATVQVHVDELLLLLPPVCFILGWTYLLNDEKVSAIGRYIRRVLTPQLEQLLKAEMPLFGWENEHRAGTGRRFRKVGQLVVDIATFCLPAVLAVTAFGADGPPSRTVLVILIAEAVGVVVLAVAIVAHADLAKASAAAG
jgi:hypothetical protein